MQKAITVIGTIHIAWGAIGLLSAFLVYIIVAGAGMVSGDEEAIWITSIVASAVAIPMFLLSLPALVGGIGLLKRRNWARILLIALSIVNLLAIPFGTILGIFTIKYLLEPRTVDIFEEEREREQTHPHAG